MCAASITASTTAGGEGPALSLRAAQEDDLPQLLGFVRQLWEHEGLPFVETEVAQTVRELLASPHLGRVFLVDVGGESAGYAVLTFGFSFEYGGRDALLDEFLLRPERRGAGLGGRVMALLEETCRALGIRALHLEVDRKNEAGRALYARRGFAGQDRLFLTKWLGRKPGTEG